MGRARGTKKNRGAGEPVPGRWPPELQDLQRRGGMAPDWHEATHGLGRGVGTVIGPVLEEDGAFIIPAFSGQFQRFRAALNHTSPSLPLLRFEEGKLYIEAVGDGDLFLNAEQAYQMLRILEERAEPSDTDLPSWRYVRAGSVDWNGVGLGSEKMAPDGLDVDANPEAVRAYITEWLLRMKSGSSVWIDRQERISVSKNNEGFLVEVDGDANEHVTEVEAAGDILSAAQDLAGISIGAEWRDGTMSLIGRHGQAEAYTGGPMSETLIAISSQEPRGILRDKSLVLRVLDRKLQFLFLGEGLSADELYLLRNTLRSIVAEREVLEEHGES